MNIMKKADITISVTSYPARIQFVSQTIESINRQSVSPARVVLYLASEEFINGEADLPDALLEQMVKGLVEVHWCDTDLKSHKKYFYAIQEYPDDIVITIDDDEIYPDTMIEELVLSWHKFPDAVSARRTNLIMLDNAGEILPYLDWIHSYNDRIQEPSMRLMAVGCAGILYPPHLLPRDAFNADAIVANALYTDDLWLKAFTAVSGIPVVLAVKEDKTHCIKGTRKTGLVKHNKFEGGNDEAVKKISGYLDRLYTSNDLFRTALLSADTGADRPDESVSVKYNKLSRGIHALIEYLKLSYAD